MNDNRELSFFNFINLNEDQILAFQNDWKRYVSQKKHYKGQNLGQGKGIVITAGGLKYFTTTYVLIHTLRSMGCLLPIEVWYHGDELTRSMCKILEKLEVRCLNTKDYIHTPPSGFLMKPLAIMYSNFREVLFLDADNNCIKDPTYLFHDGNYEKYGCMFWPDYWRTSPSNPIWSILEIECNNSPEQESGQILVNKSRCWDQLQLCLYFNMKGMDYYKLLYGDKDTFRFAWLALKSPYYMIPFDTGSCGVMHESSFYGNTMVQHDAQGEIIFLHRNLLKWDITCPDERGWKVIKRFSSHSLKKSCLLKKGLGLQRSIDLVGETFEVDFDELFPKYEETCLKALGQLRSSAFYRKELLKFYLSVSRTS